MKRQNAGDVLIVSQVYVPDPAAVGQHLADLADGLTARGFTVDVLTADRGYDDPDVVYPRREVIDGTGVRRLRFSSYGKGSLLLRAVGGLVFTLSAAVRGISTHRVDAVVITSVPPSGILGALWIAKVRRAALVYWVMDLNPDQAIALGLASKDGLMSRALHKLNGFAFRKADLLVVLDEFMEQRIRTGYDVKRPILAIAPWPHDQSPDPIGRSHNRFRIGGLVRDDQIVFMYAGNHAESAPVTTFLKAAEALKTDDRVLFFFVGGGRGKPGVEAFVAEHGLLNVRCLPYQPLEDLGELLGAADVHLVTMGENLVGINHPCKVYGAMNAARPILYVGPSPSHISSLIEEHNIGWRLQHGDINGTVNAIQGVLDLPQSELQAMGDRAQEVANSQYGKDLLLGRLSDAIEEVL